MDENSKKHLQNQFFFQKNQQKKEKK